MVSGSKFRYALASALRGKWKQGGNYRRMTMACEHEYIFQGAVCFSSKRTIPGSGAREMIYYDRYCCKKCLDIQDRNKRIIGNSYEGVKGPVLYMGEEE